MKKNSCLILMGLFVSLLSLLPAQALFSGDKAPPTYETGKLLDIQGSKDTKIVSYNTTKNKDGSSTTTPVTNTVKYYDITVKVGDLIYVGRYEPMWSWKKPEWIIGDPIEVRVENNKMYLKKADGKDLKVKIVKRIRSE